MVAGGLAGELQVNFPLTMFRNGPFTIGRQDSDS
jgi:hypothetical protein